MTKSLQSVMAPLLSFPMHFVHPDFHEILGRMTLIDRFLFIIIHLVDKAGIWHRLPVLLGALYLVIRRHLHEEYNLLSVGKTPVGVRFNPADYPYRTANGNYNDPFAPESGSHDSFFGRNMPPQDQKAVLLKPDPIVVATKLLARRKLIDTGKQFNIIAASWIQFMIHDWIDHLEDTQQVELKAPASVASECPLKSFRFYKTKEVPTGFYEIKSGSKNIRTPWWDGSGIYGSTAEKLAKVRTFRDGKLKISSNGLLLHNDEGIAVAGDVRNSWAGVSTFKPSLSWSIMPFVINSRYGILGKKFKDTFGHVGGPILGGLVGLKKPENHGVPYSLTEEFTSVYRMHSLMPDHLILRDIHGQPQKDKSPPILEEIPLEEMIGIRGEKKVADIGFESQIVSMGHQACGALELWNYPLFFRDTVPENVDGTERPDHVDLPALEIYRDRERGVPRYNQFRRNLLMIPIEKWEQLTDDKEAIELLQEVYDDDIEKLDLLVGMMAEKKIKGFAISETAFFIFLIMATRRLEADRFFTSYFNEETYTKEGFEWVNTTESLKDVIDRHYPHLTHKWLNASSAFSVWDAPPNEDSLVPLYLRTPH
ncbi:hypothetical protein AMTR_s00088p00083140 [Amborella trichopoda]|uniref:Alpha-dioxygenase 1 n=1 Tax=Amborella trichopoda TaxID=13333 RepID=W1NXW2_AMBTC|nr:hypothetical protein AMTR_s00088p00083140 [Amborella trichopoda]